FLGLIIWAFDSRAGITKAKNQITADGEAEMHLELSESFADVRKSFEANLLNILNDIPRLDRAIPFGKAEFKVVSNTSQEKKREKTQLYWLTFHSSLGLESALFSAKIVETQCKD